jgi:hypothetical protein
MRFVPTFALVIVLVLAGSAVAEAEQPIREPDQPLDSTFAAGEVCPFPLHLVSIADSGTITTFSDGHLLLTGRFVVRATDLDTGGYVDVIASGPFSLRFRDDGTTTFDVHGTYLWILGSGDVGGPGLIFTTGRVVAVADVDFFLTSFDVTGTSQDLCPAIAAA